MEDVTRIFYVAEIKSKDSAKRAELGTRALREAAAISATWLAIATRIENEKERACLFTEKDERRLAVAVERKEKERSRERSGKTYYGTWTETRSPIRK